MLHLASDFKKLSKLSQITVGLHNATLMHVHSIERWERNQSTILSTLTKITESAEQGSTRLYLRSDDIFLKTPAVHDFFTNSGFRIFQNSIDWSDELK